ncbi:MAG: 16S rRNA (uracil(1498)-N(3))-methyltransferase [Spirochaetales bacterium]|nr:16S rRNA (uracil(1498)-N(3))-methyltransferase [Spirochaetales bacterium]
MRLLLLPESFHGQKVFKITGKDARYLWSVLRLPVGQNITARDAGGRFWNLLLVSGSSSACTVNTSPLQAPKENTDALPCCGELVPITLYQCLTKPRKLEQIVRQATEIGVDRIVLVRSRFSCTEPFRQERLSAQLKEAIQQSGSTVTTRIEGPIEISAVPSDASACPTPLFFHQTSLKDQRTIAQALDSLKSPGAVLIGPEGGLDDDECTLLRNGGWEPVLLQTNILRAETAAVYALALVQTALQVSDRQKD